MDVSVHCGNQSAYRRALATGAIDVAYSRVLFVGTAGVGKTSFKRSLMKLPWLKRVNSTIVSDVNLVRPFHCEWHMLKDEQFQEVRRKEEIEELACLLAQASLASPSDTITSSEQSLEVVTSADVSENEDVQNDSSTESEPPELVIIDETIKKKAEAIFKEAMKIARVSNIVNAIPQQFLHFWDCGGQPAFLEILPAFLTSRTMFLLHFDASKGLKANWESVYHIKGKRVYTEEVPMTTLDHMLNWMANIHGHLIKKNEDGTISDYPRIYCIGTHGDLLTEKEREEVQRELISHYRDKEYEKMVNDTVIVDNTTSGEGPSFDQMRKALIEFTEEKLSVKTPISWVLLRKVFQALEENVISLDMAHSIGGYINIPFEDVEHALLFYHDLGAVLFYPHLDGLKDKVIINPKYFIDTLGKLFPLDDREISKCGHYNDWKTFHQHGILIQPLYAEIWKDNHRDLPPEAIIEVLVHFRLAAEVKNTGFCEPRYKQYFMPAVLKLSPPDTLNTIPSQDSATPLHITFQTGFVPPGFFTRFVAVIASHKKTKLSFDHGIYRNRVRFYYQDISNRSVEQITIIDLHTVIQINVDRIPSANPVPLKKVCQDLLVLLEESAEKVEDVLAESRGRGFEELLHYTVTRKLCYICNNCPQPTAPHYLILNPHQTTDVYVTCEENSIPRPLTEQEVVWFKDYNKVDTDSLCSHQLSHQKYSATHDEDSLATTQKKETIYSDNQCKSASLELITDSKNDTPASSSLAKSTTIMHKTEDTSYQSSLDTLTHTSLARSTETESTSYQSRIETTRPHVKPLEVFRGNYPELCKAISRNVDRVSDCLVPLLGYAALDAVNVDGISDYKKASNLMKLIYSHLDTAPDQQLFLSNFLDQLCEVEDETLHKLIVHFKSQL